MSSPKNYDPNLRLPATWVDRLVRRLGFEMFVGRIRDQLTTPRIPSLCGSNDSRESTPIILLK